MSKLEPLLIDQSDFSCVVQVAKHCDWEQLTIFIREQQNLSLLPKIGQCVFEKIMSYCQGYCIAGETGSCDEKERNVIKHLFIGGRYTSCDGKIKMHFGLKRVLVHWAYGAYIYRKSILDTPFGVAQKITQDSMPIDLKELEKINIGHRNSAEYYFEMTKDYLCAVKDSEALKDCNICDCIKDCKCNHCKTGKTLQRRGVTFKNISKWD